jgi:catechol 2,3-dioxygenase-like lactoylglutathione lyase family enzyme
MEINGIAHVQLCAGDFEKSSAFYRRLFEFFDMKIVFDVADYFLYGVGGRTGIAVCPAAEEHRGERFHQGRVGLHHLCFRLRSRDDVDRLHEFLVANGVYIVHPPEDGPWAPGYYSVLFEDPDGIRLEANHVPGKGVLDPSVQLPKGSYG